MTPPPTPPTIAILLHVTNEQARSELLALCEKWNRDVPGSVRVVRQARCRTAVPIFGVHAQ